MRAAALADFQVSGSPEHTSWFDDTVTNDDAEIGNSDGGENRRKRQLSLRAPRLVQGEKNPSTQSGNRMNKPKSQSCSHLLRYSYR